MEERAAPKYALTRFMLVRALGLVYFTAFLVAWKQGPALIGESGLMGPRALYEDRLTKPGAGPGWSARPRLGTYLPPLSRDSPGLASRGSVASI